MVSIVYMVAGLSSRFNGKLKALAKISKDESLIEYSLNQALPAGFDKIVFIVSNKTKPFFQEKFGESYKNIPIQYALQNYDSTKNEIADYTKKLNKKPSLLIVKLGQDVHDRGANVVASAYKDLGFETKVGPLFQTPGEAAKLVKSFLPDVVAASSLAGGHLRLIPQMIDQIRANGNNNILVIAGGVIPFEDYEKLEKFGVNAIFGPGTNIMDAARRVLGLIEQRPVKNK